MTMQLQRSARSRYPQIETTTKFIGHITHVSEHGIYTAQTTAINRYSLDGKCIGKWGHDGGCRARILQDDADIVFSTTREIFRANTKSQMSYSNLIAVGSDIMVLRYHPYQRSYLVIDGTRQDIICKYSEQFDRFLTWDYDFGCCDVIPSRYSPNTYAAAEHPSGALTLTVIAGNREAILSQYVGHFDPITPFMSPIIKYRPHSNDVITVLYEGLHIFDPWHTGRSAQKFPQYVDGNVAGEHVNANVYVIAADAVIQIIDIRYGAIRRLPNKIMAHKLWAVDGTLYVANGPQMAVYK